MGKSISDQEYRLANTRLQNCSSAACRSNTRHEDDNFCSACKSSHRVKKDYERTHAGLIGAGK